MALAVLIFSEGLDSIVEPFFLDEYYWNTISFEFYFLVFYVCLYKSVWTTLISGSATGSQANPRDVSEVRQATKQLPILIGSGITPENVNEFSNADGFIVGSYLKENGFWSAEMDEKRVEKMVQAVQK